MTTLQTRTVLVILCFMAVTHARNVTEITDNNSDAKLNSVELINKWGYPSEAHSVKTEDGYLLTVHRIRHGKDMTKATKPPVMIQHGLLCSSADWIYTGPEKSFAFILADAGYDVWLGNARGNTYSRVHVSLSTSDAAFWEFSWHEMGKYDLPAVIDYITQLTGEDKIYYAGHSMGTTMFYVMASLRPEYNDKIRAMFSLSPVAFMSHLKSPVIKSLVSYSSELQFLAHLIGLHEFLPHMDFLSTIGEHACDNATADEDICSSIIFQLGGYNQNNINRTILPLIVGHTPAGTSTRVLLHYAQGVNSGKFTQYDFGLIGNIINYRWLTVPKYNLNMVTVPVALYYSYNDWLSNVLDVEQLYRELGNPIGIFKVPEFGHFDYMWAIDAPNLVYYKVMDLMEKY